MKRLILALAVLWCIIAGVQAQTNLALGKRATQSIDADPVNGLASKAVDGNTDGNWAHGSVTHTVDGGSSDPWWQVDLGNVYNIHSILVWNRTDCCAERFTNAKVLIKSAENEPWHWFSPENRLYTYSQRNPIAFRNNINGRYIRVQLEGPKAILSMAEVVVYGDQVQAAAPVLIDASVNEASLGTNVAIGKPATQSSDADAVKGQASKAVDGNTDGNWANGSVTHTVDGGSESPWWRVDLGADYQITAVQLFNRTDCCSERLNQVVILVGSDPKALPFFASGQGYYYNRQNPVTFRDDKVGRYVMVLLQGPKAILSLAEVKVFGTPVPEPVAVVPEPAPEPETQPSPVVAPPEPCGAPSAPRAGYAWDTATCSWIRVSHPPDPNPVAPSGPVIPPPEIAPFVRLPHDNTPFNVMPRKVAISWDAVGGTRNYIVEIEVLAQGTWGLYDTQRVSALFIEPTLGSDGTFRFHVAGMGSDGSPGQFSPWRTFTFNTMAPPAPAQIFPTDGYEWNCGPTPGCGRAVFRWRAADRAARYIVVVEAYQNGAWRPFRAESTTGLQMEMNFPTGVPGRWSVQSVSDNGVLGGSSFQWSFQVHWKVIN